MEFKSLLKSVKLWIINHKITLGIVILYGFIALSLMAPMASSQVIAPYPDTSSHVGYIVQGRMALEEGQFPLRVAPVEDNGWRYPGFQFYSQFPYFFGALIYKFLLPYNPYDAYKLVVWTALLVGAFYIYRLSFKLTEYQIPAILAGISYMSAPYFLNNIHARGAFTEAIAQGILPIALYYVIQCYNTGKKRDIILSSLSWFLLATTHIITFVYGTLFIGLLGLIVILQTRTTDFKLSRLIPVGKAYGLAWLLGIYFLAPVALVSRNLSINKQIKAINPFDTRWYTPLSNLLSPTSLPPAPTETGLAPTYGLHPAIGWIFLAAWGVVIYYYYFSRSIPAKLEPTRPYLIGLLWVFIVALFVTWSPINFWIILPRQFWVAQFTFRFLTHIMWAGALLTAYASILIFRRRFDRRHLILGILIIVLASRPWLPIPRSTATVEDLLKEPLFRYSGALDYLYRTPVKKLYGKTDLLLSHPDWIPGYSTWDTFVNHPLILEAELYYPVWQKNEKPVLHLQGEIPLDNIADKASLEVQVNGQRVDIIDLVDRQLDWQVPFDKVAVNDENFGLKFLVNGATKDGQFFRIRVNKLWLEGLSPEHTTIPVSETQEKCSQQGVKTVCEITVKQDAQIVQLPVLYYKGMQKIWVDGERVDYFPVYYRDYNLVGLDLKPGTYKIEVTFHGLAWANWISGLAWLGLIGVIFSPIIQRKLNK
ncbi:6-pyruvoyl-tetrahydropterin synthase-related protein [Crocosphaera sp. XPORK-15E]|uniref:6-pyruvoyl-tetrahydropterin synthase-related protein n=1 Tax=Crocosphaera sp. XPORK-15E TaxID=3110247 RepID=UPI002B213DFD|nr:6-pyruvoyl-tetrahydropterin synthase-related protein [Crocosphaera sp. XPORK-15E]MEA5533094.1 6-pyruvoyl-tetrahydropterin synthase-related protein [Crocosphaera sp. XPORK-15E]